MRAVQVARAVEEEEEEAVRVAASLLLLLPLEEALML